MEPKNDSGVPPSTEGPSAATASQEVLPSTPADLMREFDQLRTREKEVVEKLDQQLVENIKRAGKWITNNVPPTEDAPHDQLLKVKTTTAIGAEKTLQVRVHSNGLDVSEFDDQGKYISLVSFIKAEYEMAKNPGDARVQVSGSIAYSTPEDPDFDKVGRPGNYGQPIYYGSTAYGYRENIRHRGSRRTGERIRIINPGMEHLPNPIEVGSSTLDMLERGQVTEKLVERSESEIEDKWEPIPQNPIQPQPNT